MLSSLRCALDLHAAPVHDRQADGTQVLRCPRCWRVKPYLEVDDAALAQLRAGQRAQAQAIAAVKAEWKRAIREQADA